ncbi:MAG: peptidase U32 family protein [Desulfurivibrio sp.]|nr:peptidase U32 family protein [Desulfurivibrio sp.]
MIAHLADSIIEKNASPKLPELLAPAGNPEKLAVAIHYGADAVYLAGKSFGLRAHAGNFNDDELVAAVQTAHAAGVKVYVTVNIFAHQDDLAPLPAYLLRLRANGVDGLIIADPGVLAVARRTVPELPIHLSTQANVTNVESARFWTACGVRRINPARELTLAELGQLRGGSEAELEIFVHGALCIAYSGRCFMSLYLTGRDANRGDCAQPCRYRYRLEEEKRPGQFWPVDEDGRGVQIFNARDLCLLARLPELLRLPVDALKLEGRMKSLFYVGAVVRLYRAALDYWRQHGLPAAGESDGLPPEFAAELARIGSRGQSSNFLDGPPTAHDMLYEGTTVNRAAAPAGLSDRAANGRWWNSETR